MTSKRSRSFRTPSLSDACMLDCATSIDLSFRNEKRTKVLHSTSVSKPCVSKPIQFRQDILILDSSREDESESPQIKFHSKEVGDFLKACYGCRKRIGEKDEVFMYNDLGAFCSNECRDKQIALEVHSSQVKGSY
ncbi:hypothetical protein ACHQM5_023231 [Ranunculus cassubicifolius]